MHYFSLHCHCVSLDLAISAVPLHYPSAELSTQLPIPLYFSTVLTIQYKDTRKWHLNPEFNYLRPSEMLVSR